MKRLFGMANSLKDQPRGQVAQLERRLFLRKGLSLGALTLLAGCSVTDGESLQKMLWAMSRAPLYPSLFQINTRAWLRQQSREAGKPITLADVDDKTLDGFAERGFDWIWSLSVWRTGAAGRAVSRSNRNGAKSSRPFFPT